MNAVLPLIATILQAGSYTLDKVILSAPRVNYKAYVRGSYPLIFLITLLVFLVVRPPLSGALFSGYLLWLMLLSIGLSVGTNLIFYRALDADRLGEIQTIDLLSNLPIIVVSSVFFADERNFFVAVPALIAALAAVWSHWQHHRIKIARQTLMFLIWSLFVTPISAALSKVLLGSWNPISLELVRSGTIALIVISVFRNHINRAPARNLYLLIATNIATALAWILFYFSYQRFGVVYTTLIFTLQPLLVYIAAVWVLKERPDTRKSIAFGIVLSAIAIAFFMGQR